MIYFLRNISIRLWISVGLAIPITFTTIPTVQRMVPNLSTAIFCIFITIFLFILTGYLMNLAGERAIFRYISDAKNWERDGIFNKSEVYYLKALEIFDSYLLTALTSRKIALPLTGAIARFSLTASWRNDHFDMATTFFLQKNPHEIEVAHLWLNKMVKRKKTIPLSPQEENLLTLLAEMEPLNPQLVPMLSEIFTRTQRADFAAKRVFSITNGSRNNDGKQRSDSDIEINVECQQIDQLSQESQPLFNNLEQPEELNKIPAIYPYQAEPPFSTARRVRNIKITKRPATYLMPSAIKTALAWIISLAIKVVIWISSIPMTLLSLFFKWIQFFLQRIIQSFKMVLHTISLHPGLRKNVKRLILLVIVSGVMMLFANTLSHLFRTPSPPPPSTPKIVAENVEVQVIPQKKFTIQVAAYLSKSHAEQYLNNLEKKGVSGGGVIAVEGGGKTWYLIRVGEYETKDSATSYGNSLKSQGLVKDFFVDNSGV